MNYTKNAGYGQIVGQLPFLASGKVMVVGKAALASRHIMEELFKVDPDGEVRFFATIDAAVGECDANRGDVIYVMPGHTETLSNATTMNLDIAGITIIGLGEGSLRPTITFDTATTATIPVTAANITIKNVIFTADFEDIVSVFTLTAAKYFKLDGCYFKETESGHNFLGIVDTSATTGAENGLSIVNCKWIEPDTATLSMVKMDGDMSDVEISNNYVHLGVKNNTAALLTIANGKSVFELDMDRNRVFRLNTDTATGAILMHTDQTDNSGIISNNRVQVADTGAELLVTASAGVATIENYCSGVAGASGYLLPAGDS